MLREAARCDAADPPDRAACDAACDLGHSNSCARAASSLAASGDADGAAALARRACEGGSGLGCEAIGDLRRARFYLHVHCEQGHARSCAALGRIFAEGRGGPVDSGAASALLARACSLGARDACPAPRPAARAAPASPARHF
jgi:TPR repeat protein